MMIVTDEMVEKALAYLGDDPHPLAIAEYNLTAAKNARETLFAQLFSGAQGKSVKDRECEVECDPDYIAARQQEADKVFELTRHKARSRWAATVADLWRTVNANARAAERVR